MSHRRRLVLAFLAVLLLFGAALAVSWWSDALRQDSVAAVEASIRRQRLLNEVKAETPQLQRQILTFVALRDDPTQPEATADARRQLVGRVRTAGVRIRLLSEESAEDSTVSPIETAATSAAAASAESTRRMVDLFERLDRLWVAAIESDPASSASFEQLEADSQRVAAALAQDVAASEVAEQRRLDRAFERFSTVQAQARWANTGAFVLAAVLAIGLLASVTAPMARGLRRLRRATRHLGGGALDYRVPRLAVRELDDLGQGFNQMAERLAAVTADRERARDAAEAASQAKSTFLANMSHELRTPLASILGYGEIAIEDHDAQRTPQRADLERIVAAGRDLQSRIDEVLDLSKIEAGHAQVERRTIDLRALLDDVVATVAPLADRGGNRLVRALPDALESLETDAAKLRDVLLNLLSNACKFTEGGEIELRVSQEPSTVRAPGRTEIAVSDTGIGMSTEELRRVFEPFVQADASTTRRYGGTGLGLAISRELCHLLGGELRAESEPGRGSRFVVDIPTNG